MCNRQGGINGGRGGSPMMMAPDRRFIGENSTVGAGGHIASCVASAAKVQGSGRVANVSFGDDTTSQGRFQADCTIGAAQQLPEIRSEARRVRKECDRTGDCRWSRG